AASALGNGPLSPSLRPSDANPGGSRGVGSAAGIRSSDGRTNRAPSLTCFELARFSRPDRLRLEEGRRLRRLPGGPRGPAPPPPAPPAPPQIDADAHDRDEEEEPEQRAPRTALHRHELRDAFGAPSDAAAEIPPRDRERESLCARAVRPVHERRLIGM